MVFSHPLVLFGLLLVAVPVILHLLMRTKPKKLLFPALRLIQSRKKTNTRRMRLRHLWLLLLRMAVIGLLAFAVARPKVPATDYSLRGGDWLRLIVVAGAAVAAYFGFLSLWKRRKTPAHEYIYKRSLLRAGLGAATVLAFALFVAWPYQRRIAAAITQPTLVTDEFLPVAAVMLFDTSKSMEYQHDSKTRLEVAQEIAAKHIGNLPRGSRLALCDTAGQSQIRFSSDLAGVGKRASALAVQVVNRAMDDRILEGLEAQEADREQTRSADRAGSNAAGEEGILREIYVFTDLAASAWRKEASSRLHEALERMPGINVYLIDVGVPSPTNLAITELTLSDQTLPLGAPLDVHAAITATGIEPGERVVELSLENAAGKLVKHGQQPVKIDPASAATASFSLRPESGPVLQGEVRLVSSDPLAFDDVRYFSVFVQPPSDVLVVTDAAGDALYLTEALAPAELVSQGEARFRCKLIGTSQLAATDLSKYAIVCLVNVSDPGKAGWQPLEGFVSNGGGLAIFLGDRVNQVAYLPAAKNVLPGMLNGQFNFVPPEYFDLRDLTHPIFKKFADWDGVGILTGVEILKYWSVTAEKDTGVIATYTDFRHHPAFLERAIGKGRVLLMTTSIDRRWNDLPVADWGFLALADQMMRYLSRSSQAVFNYTAGENVILALDSSQRIPAYQLHKPGLQQLKSDIQPGATSLVLQESDQLGNYYVQGVETDARFERGFSVNSDPAESRLERLSSSDLDAHLGAERYSLARDIENLQRAVKTGRLGREAFPMAVLALLIFFVAESVVANRFYKSEQTSETESAGDERSAAA
jgi:hypothetical protein